MELDPTGVEIRSLCVKKGPENDLLIEDVNQVAVAKNALMFGTAGGFALQVNNPRMLRKLRGKMITILDSGF
jgi:hypothetical protein